MSSAIFGCANWPRILPSRLNLSANAWEATAKRKNFTATWRSNRPSMRSASQTLPIPPSPMREMSRYGPSVSPAKRRSVAGHGGYCSRKCS